ncbi:expressed unknown protein [Seminavis robusta]|uniref:Reverse transcriptase zinc-binding domain-containing protein n=1 Tax=Seminavis robusta TaxID=568900 RepID=A0A9N8EJ05_9STRA|nr:expressed unknown protein [Seminavis robusta]|eukprot:Sro1278_g258811.1  (277) ;mRNA; f:30102-30932
MKDYNWSEDTFNDIDWTAHGRALRRHDNHRPTMVKYLNKVLPVGAFLHKTNPKYYAGCPSCNNPSETRHHLMECSSPERIKWREKCYSAVLAYVQKKDTSPKIQGLLLSGLKVCLHHQNPTTIQEDPSWDTLKQAQDAIGWHHLLKGRISKQFSQEQDRYLNMKKTATKRNNGLTWLTGLIDIIYKEWWKLWDMRNQDRHGHDMRTKSQAKKAQAIRQLTQFYEAYQQEVPEHLEWLFQIPLESRMQLNTPVIIQFLNTWEPVLQESHYTTALETG